MSAPLICGFCIEHEQRGCIEQCLNRRTDPAPARCRCRHSGPTQKLTKTQARAWLKDARRAIALAEDALKLGDSHALADAVMHGGGALGEVESAIERGEAEHWELRCRWIVFEPESVSICSQPATYPTRYCSEHAYRARTSTEGRDADTTAARG